MDGGGPRRDHLLYGPGDVKGASPARIDIDQERQGGRRSDSAQVGEYLLQGRHAEIRQAEGIVRDAGAGKIHRPVSDAFRHHGRVGVDGANDLQGFFFFKGEAEPAAGAAGGRTAARIAGICHL